MSMGKYANYLGVLAGYESVKIGVINELDSTINLISITMNSDIN